MKISLVHGHRPSREVIARALNRTLDADVTTYSCCEDLLTTALDYHVFVVYNNFGPRKMRGMTGAAKIRKRSSGALIVGVTAKPYLRRRFLKAGADAALLRAGNEIAELLVALRRVTAHEDDGAEVEEDDSEDGNPTRPRVERHNQIENLQ